MLKERSALLIEERGGPGVVGWLVRGVVAWLGRFEKTFFLLATWFPPWKLVEFICEAESGTHLKLVYSDRKGKTKSEISQAQVLDVFRSVAGSGVP